MSETPGFLFEVPPVLLRRCLYLPLISRVVMPGGALSLPTMDAPMRDLFEQLKARDELIVLAHVHDPDPWAQQGSPRLHQTGCLAMVVELASEADHWMTTFAGVGRVSLGPPVMSPGDAWGFPRMDVTPVATRCEDLIEARLAISTFRSVSAGLGGALSHVVQALHAYASFEQPPSLVADRLAGLVGMQDAAWMQRVLDEPEVVARLRMVNDKLLDFMAAVRAASSSQRD